MRKIIITLLISIQSASYAGWVVNVLSKKELPSDPTIEECISAIKDGALVFSEEGPYASHNKYIYKRKLYITEWVNHINTFRCNYYGTLVEEGSDKAIESIKAMKLISNSL